MARTAPASQGDGFSQFALMQQMMEKLGEMHGDFAKGLARIEEVAAQMQKKEEAQKVAMPPAPKLSIDYERLAELVLPHLKPGKDGVNPDPKEVARMAAKMINIPKQGLPGPRGNDAKLDLGQFTKDFLDMLKEGKITLSPEHIKGLKNEIATIRNMAANPPQIYGKTTWARGGGDTVQAGSGITIISTPDGTKLISASGTAGGNSILMLAIPSPAVGNGNTVFTVPGTVVIAGSDDGADAVASVTHNATTDISTITYSVPPQNNVFAFVLATTSPELIIPAGAVGGGNVTFTAPGRISTVFTDRVVDVGAVLSYSALTNITTITCSAPPQNDVSALAVGGFPITTQTPTCTTNATGNPDKSAVTFSAVGQINAAVGDSGIDTAALLAYNYATNVTIITYSVPPEFNVSTF